MNALRASLVRPAVLGELWTSVKVVETTGSTNTDLLARGGPEGQVLVAEEQTAGRGRMGRSWVSQPGEALTVSVLLRPVTVPASRRGWLPLLTGIAVATAVRSAASVAATLKWPNDVLAGDRKLAGILAEQSGQSGQSGSGAASGDALVIGIGLNVTTPSDALPVSPGGLRGTSLLAEGSPMDREPLLVEMLRGFERWYLPFRADPDPARTGLLAEYRSLCATLGRHVRVDLPGGRVLSGMAEDVDPDGRLLVREDATAGVSPVSAGDVIHLR